MTMQTSIAGLKAKYEKRVNIGRAPQASGSA
jgi:hypothetical protein